VRDVTRMQRADERPIAMTRYELELALQVERERTYRASIHAENKPTASRSNVPWYVGGGILALFLILTAGMRIIELFMEHIGKQNAMLHEQNMAAIEGLAVQSSQAATGGSDFLALGMGLGAFVVFMIVGVCKGWFN